MGAAGMEDVFLHAAAEIPCAWAACDDYTQIHYFHDYLATAIRTWKMAERERNWHDIKNLQAHPHLQKHFLLAWRTIINPGAGRRQSESIAWHCSIVWWKLDFETLQLKEEDSAGACA